MKPGDQFWWKHRPDSRIQVEITGPLSPIKNDPRRDSDTGDEALLARVIDGPMTGTFVVVRPKELEPSDRGAQSE